MKSKPRFFKSSYGGKVSSDIFISISVNLNGLGHTEINKCFQGPYRTVYSAQGPVNSILCTGTILTGRTGASIALR